MLRFFIHKSGLKEEKRKMKKAFKKFLMSIAVVVLVAPVAIALAACGKTVTVTVPPDMTQYVSKGDYDTLQSQMNNAATAYNLALEAKEAQIYAKGEEIKSKQSQIDAKQATVDKLTKDIADLEEALLAGDTEGLIAAAINAKQTIINGLNADKIALSGEIDDLNGQLAALQSAYDDLINNPAVAAPIAKYVFDYLKVDGARFMWEDRDELKDEDIAQILDAIHALTMTTQGDEISIRIKTGDLLDNVNYLMATQNGIGRNEWVSWTQDYTQMGYHYEYLQTYYDGGRILESAGYHVTGMTYAGNFSGYQEPTVTYNAETNEFTFRLCSVTDYGDYSYHAWDYTVGGGNATEEFEVFDHTEFYDYFTTYYYGTYEIDYENKVWQDFTEEDIGYYWTEYSFEYYVEWIKPDGEEEYGLYVKCIDHSNMENATITYSKATGKYTVSYEFVEFTEEDLGSSSKYGHKVIAPTWAGFQSGWQFNGYYENNFHYSPEMYGYVEFDEEEGYVFKRVRQEYNPHDIYVTKTVIDEWEKGNITPSALSAYGYPADVAIHYDLAEILAEYGFDFGTVPAADIALIFNFEKTGNVLKLIDNNGDAVESEYATITQTANTITVTINILDKEISAVFKIAA
jgi:hypothetical protein